MKETLFSRKTRVIKAIFAVTALFLLISSEFSFADTASNVKASDKQSARTASVAQATLSDSIKGSAAAKISSLASQAKKINDESKRIEWIREAVGSKAVYSKSQSDPSTLLLKNTGNASAFSIAAGYVAERSGITVRYTSNSRTGNVTLEAMINGSWTDVLPMFKEAGDTLDCLAYEENLTKDFYGYYVNAKSVSSTEISTQTLKEIDDAIRANDVADLQKYNISASKAKTLAYCYTLYSSERKPIDIATKDGKIVYVCEANDVWLSAELTDAQKKQVIKKENQIVKKTRRIRSIKGRVRYLNSYLKKTYKYKSNKYDNDVYGVLIKHQAVCGGYAQAFYQLAVKSGIPVKLRISQSHNHAWNEVKVGGKWRTVDVTWNDTTHTNRYLFSSIRNWK
jgi:transglutaminase/protease-like cytokinesis protein 3